jgi:hypothetical protein
MLPVCPATAVDCFQLEALIALRRLEVAHQGLSTIPEVVVTWLRGSRVRKGPFIGRCCSNFFAQAPLGKPCLPLTSRAVS